MARSARNLTPPRRKNTGAACVEGAYPVSCDRLRARGETMSDQRPKNRRDFLSQALVLTGAGLLGGAARVASAFPLEARTAGTVRKVVFPAGFRWGAATASYQIEGATRRTARRVDLGPLRRTRPGKVQNGDTATSPATHYHRWRDDIALLRAGPRQPTASRSPGRASSRRSGRAERDGLDLLQAPGRRPARRRRSARSSTLYHWDLPQALEDAGGWPARETADALRRVRPIVVRALGDRVTTGIVSQRAERLHAASGYGYGGHAPGRTDPRAMLRADPRREPRAGRRRPRDPRRAATARLQVKRATRGRRFTRRRPTPEGSRRRPALAVASGTVVPRAALPDAIRTSCPGGRPPGERSGSRTATRSACKAPLDFVGLTHYKPLLRVGPDRLRPRHPGLLSRAAGDCTAPTTKTDTAGRSSRAPSTTSSCGMDAARPAGLHDRDHGERRLATTTGPARTGRIDDGAASPSAAATSPTSRARSRTAPTARLSRLEPDGQLRVGRGLQQALRPRARRLQDRQAHDQGIRPAGTGGWPRRTASDPAPHQTQRTVPLATIIV